MEDSYISKTTIDIIHNVYVYFSIEEIYYKCKCIQNPGV